VAADALRDLAKAAGIRFGAAVNVEALNTDSAYAQLLAREFNLVTRKNAMSFLSCTPSASTTTSPRPTPWSLFAEAHACR